MEGIESGRGSEAAGRGRDGIGTRIVQGCPLVVCKAVLVGEIRRALP